jgi:hypothetical protein
MRASSKGAQRLKARVGTGAFARPAKRSEAMLTATLS